MVEYFPHRIVLNCSFLSSHSRRRLSRSLYVVSCEWSKPQTWGSPVSGWPQQLASRIGRGLDHTLLSSSIVRGASSWSSTGSDGPATI